MYSIVSYLNLCIDLVLKLPKYCQKLIIGIDIFQKENVSFRCLLNALSKLIVGLDDWKNLYNLEYFYLGRIYKC